ncbi:MAG TPA: type II toxin-antitoxin system VapC family toxin [Pyrinomonadaceae bacterium]|nr:type II toxin-antitoxin system VapC family toxin [Pyrinomonadaceae bacterium]
MTAATPIVLDSWPVLAYLQGEKPAQRVIDIIGDAHDRGAKLSISAINAGEVWYISAQRRGPDQADLALQVIQSLGIEIIDVDWPITKIAASYKAQGGISYADCFAAALAKQSAATLVTGDHEFHRLEKDITILWLKC